VFRILRSVLTLAPIALSLGAVPVASETAASGIPSAHPRLVLVGGRLEELRDLACYDANGNPIPGCTRSSQASQFLSFMTNKPEEAEAWQWALLYMITGDETAATRAIQRADRLVACGCSASPGHASSSCATTCSVALVYDWLFDRLTAQQKHDYIGYMNQMLFLTERDAEAQAIYDTDDWMTSNPMNNFYYIVPSGHDVRGTRHRR
jgi:hypothetical protein